VIMTSDANYITVLPDDAYNDVKSTYADKQRHSATDDDAKVTSAVTSLYEHPQLSERVDGERQQSTTYQRVIANDLQLVTPDMTYDEIADVPSPPPPRPGWLMAVFNELFSSNSVDSKDASYVG